MLYIPITRILIGLCQISWFFFILIKGKSLVDISQHLFGLPWATGSLEFDGTLHLVDKSLLYDETGHLTAAATLGFFLYVAILFVSLIYMVRGGYKVLTWQTGPIAKFNSDHAWEEIKDGSVFEYVASGEKSSDYKNIDSTLKYIKNKNVGLTREKATDNLISITGGLSLASHSELSYIDGKLSRMSISNGSKYLMNRK